MKLIALALATTFYLTIAPVISTLAHQETNAWTVGGKAANETVLFKAPATGSRLRKNESR